MHPPGEGQPRSHHLFVGPGPEVEEILALVEMAQVVEALGNGRQGQTGAEGQEALGQPLVPGQRDRRHRPHRRRPERGLDLLGGHPPRLVHRLVETGQNQNGHVHRADIAEQDQSRAARMQIRRMVVVVQRLQPGGHGQPERPPQRLDVGLRSRLGAGRG